MPRPISERIVPSTPPSPGNPDRKRVLNVLAQRRYRQRKRERLAALEAQAKAASQVSQLQEKSSPEEFEALPTPSDTCSSSSGNTLSDPTTANNLDVSSTSLLADPIIELEDIRFQNTSTFPLEEFDDDVAVQSDFDLNNVLDMSLFQEDDAAIFSDQTQSNTSAVQAFQLFNQPLTFSKDANIEVPILKTLRAGLAIAQLLKCEQIIWDPLCLRTLDPSNLPPLPASLYPTDAQVNIPHHPLFDILPWPSLRTKLICIFALPPELRPPIARDPMAIMQISMDVDDSTEGFRVEGADGTKEEDWEVGEAFFRNWWWALDRRIIDNTNRIRTRRGACKLMLGQG